jgi:hypothetical protein
MTRRSPQLTSALAKDVYALTNSPSIKDAIGALNARYGKILSFADTNLLNARTGGPAGIKISSAFGFVLIGPNSYTKCDT